jgi:hypothetical protein
VIRAHLVAAVADAMLPTPAAATPGDRAGAGVDDAAALQHDPYDLDQIGNLGDMLPPTPAADDDADPAAAAGAAGADGDGQPAAAATAAAGGTPTKTFQRRNTRQQAKEAEGNDEAAAAAGDAGAEGGEGAGGAKGRVAPMTAAKSARRRRVSGLLGLKRRVMVDVGDADAAAGEVGVWPCCSLGGLGFVV